MVVTDNGGGILRSMKNNKRPPWNLGKEHLLQFLCFELLGTVIKEFLVHLHEEFQGVVYQAVYCPAE